MRNIKTTLRYARNSALLFAAASGMAYLTACSETDINPDNGGNNGDDNVLVESIKVTAGTNPNLATTYPNSHQVGTRGAFDVPEMKKMPALPEKYDVILPTYWDQDCLTIDLPAGTPQADYAYLKDIDKATIYVPAGYQTGLPVSFKVAYNTPGTYTEANGYSGNDAWRKEIVITHPKYYVDSEVTVTGFGGDGFTERELHILNGGVFSSGSDIPDATTIYLYGGGDILKAASGNVNLIHHKGSLIAEAPIDHPDTDITVQGNIYTTQKINGKNVTLVGGEIYAGCGVSAKQEIKLTGNASNISAGYVSAPTITISGSDATGKLNIHLRDGGYLNATSKLNLTNTGNTLIEAASGEYAMVETDVLNVENKRLKGTFYNVAVKYNTQTGTEEKGADETEVVLEWNETVKVNGFIDYTVEDTGDACAPKTVNGPKPPVTPPTVTPGTGDDDDDPDPTPVLENVGEVAPTGDHTHPISATCVYTNGNDAYLSWHTQGPNFHGCIEYLTVNGGNVTLNAYLETAPSNDLYGAIDFNHVIFDNGKIFVAGDHPKKGGILGWIECNNGAFVTGEAELKLKELYNGEGGSGNCIIRNGNYYQVASVKGFETYNVNDFNIGASSNRAVARLAAYDFDPAGENAQLKQSGKHIAIGGDKVVMLTLINRDNEANTAQASIKVYSATDIEYKNEIASYVVNDAVLTPVDGKDVIAIEGNNIYVCLGNGGVQRLELAGNTITKKAEFAIKDVDYKSLGISDKEAAASCANGLAVGKDYLYVAHGGSGLVVLDKTTLDFVTRTRYNGGASANYVRLSGNEEYIYVAYGKSNIQVFAWKKD